MKTKRDVINSPLAIGFWSWGHALTLIGYKTIQAGDIIFIETLNEWDDAYEITIENDDPRIGQTALLLKNSWGDDWGKDDGFCYVITDISDIMAYGKVILPITSLNYTNSNIICEDKDGDGYYFWGIGKNIIREY